MFVLLSQLALWVVKIVMDFDMVVIMFVVFLLLGDAYFNLKFGVYKFWKSPRWSIHSHRP